MSDPNDLTANETDVEIRRVCSLLERIAEQYPDGSPESVAIAEAAEAFILVRQHQSLARAHQRLKAVSNGELTDEMIAKLRQHGIEPSNLDDADF